MTAPLGPLAWTAGCGERFQCELLIANASLQTPKLTPAQPAMAAAPLKDRNWRRVDVLASVMGSPGVCRASVDAGLCPRYRRTDSDHRRMELRCGASIATRAALCDGSVKARAASAAAECACWTQLTVSCCGG